MIRYQLSGIYYKTPKKIRLYKDKIPLDRSDYTREEIIEMVKKKVGKNPLQIVLETIEKSDKSFTITHHYLDLHTTRGKDIHTS
jgi:hypothetical protein